MLLLTEGFANPTLPAISHNGVADLLADREPKPRMRTAATCANYQHIISREMVVPVNAIEVIAREQTLLFFESQFFSHV